MVAKEFKVNNYITLKLEDNQTIIYVNGEKFNQCKYLAFQIDAEEASLYEDVQSIDEMEQQDRAKGYKNLNISPEEEFWGLCSNLQAWVENDYDTRLLHRNLAFPLLRKLTQIGDPIAKKFFKEEIIYRLEEGNEKVVIYLQKEGYLDIFSRKEIYHLVHSIKSPIVKLLLQGIQYNAPSHFYNNIDKLRNNMEFTEWIIQNYGHMVYLFWGGADFFDNFDKFKENMELAKWAFDNRVHKVFYDNFNALSENPELAKWGFENNAPYEFYENFHEIKQNDEIAKWGIKNNAPDTFYKNFSAVCKKSSNINVLPLSNQLKEKYLKEFPKD